MYKFFSKIHLLNGNITVYRHILNHRFIDGTSFAGQLRLHKEPQHANMMGS